MKKYKSDEDKQAWDYAWQVLLRAFRQAGHDHNPNRATQQELRFQLRKRGFKLRPQTERLYTKSKHLASVVAAADETVTVFERVEALRAPPVQVSLDIKPPGPVTVTLPSGYVIDVPRPIVEALEIMRRKGQDYNVATGRDAYFPMGLPSYSQMIHTKSMRLVNLSKTGMAPNFESARDTALDLINYAAFLADWLDREQLK